MIKLLCIGLCGIVAFIIVFTIIAIAMIEEWWKGQDEFGGWV